MDIRRHKLIGAGLQNILVAKREVPLAGTKNIMKFPQPFYAGNKRSTRENRRKRKDGKHALFSIAKQPKQLPLLQFKQLNKCLPARNGHNVGNTRSFFGSIAFNVMPFLMQSKSNNCLELDRTCNTFAPKFVSTPLFAPFERKPKQPIHAQQEYYNKIQAEVTRCLATNFAKKDTILENTLRWLANPTASRDEDNALEANSDNGSAIGHERCPSPMSMGSVNASPQVFGHDFNDETEMEDRKYVWRENALLQSWCNKVPNSDLSRNCEKMWTDNFPMCCRSDEQIDHEMSTGELVPTTPHFFKSLLTNTPTTMKYKGHISRSVAYEPFMDTVAEHMDFSFENTFHSNEDSWNLLFPINTHWSDNSKNLIDEIFQEFQIPNLPARKPFSPTPFLRRKRRMIDNEKDQANSSLFSDMRPSKRLHLMETSTFSIESYPGHARIDTTIANRFHATEHQGASMEIKRDAPVQTIERKMPNSLNETLELNHQQRLGRFNETADLVNLGLSYF